MNTVSLNEINVEELKLLEKLLYKIRLHAEPFDHKTLDNIIDNIRKTL